MTEAVAAAILTSSSKSFQRTRSLIKKYGLVAATDALDLIGIMMKDGTVKRMRVYGRDDGGIGPAR